MGGRLPLERVVMLAPPNHGSRVAQAFASYAIFRWLYGPAGQQVVRADDWPVPDCPFGVIAGTRAVSPWNPVSWATRGLGLLPPHEPSDGTVTVAETRLPQMADFATVPCSHTWIMDDPEVRRMIVKFLDHGRFQP
jgi:triacylglycerol lipase